MNKDRYVMCLHCGKNYKYKTMEERDELRDILILHEAECPQNPLVKRIKELETEKKRWIIQIFKARDALIEEDTAEAFHQLYKIASKSFGDLNPWGKLEKELEDK